MREQGLCRASHVCFLFYFLKIFLAVPHGVWDLSFPTEDPTCVPCSGSVRINHWTTREVPELPMISRCSKDGGCAVGPGALGQLHNSSEEIRPTSMSRQASLVAQVVKKPPAVL